MSPRLKVNSRSSSPVNPQCPNPGRAVQVNPIKPTLKPSGTKRLKLNYDEPLSERESERERCLRVHKEAPGFRPGPCEREALPRA